LEHALVKKITSALLGNENAHAQIYVTPVTVTPNAHNSFANEKTVKINPVITPAMAAEGASSPMCCL